MASSWPLYKRYWDRLDGNPMQNMEVKVSSIISNGTWQWPRIQRSVILDLRAQTPASFLPVKGRTDTVRLNNHPTGLFSSRTAWEALRTKTLLVPWYSVVWCPDYVPRWSIIEWLALLQCLATQD